MSDDDTTDGMGQAMEFELLAAALRANAGDMGAFLEGLAAKLGGALPHRVRIERGGGFLSHTHPVHRLAVDLGEWAYLIEAQSSGALNAARTHTVRGIALKSESLALDEWIDALSAELAALAQRDAREHAALQRLLT
jgi:hypothetical protein